MSNKYFELYNPNPKGKDTKDCVYRALTVALDITWEDVARLSGEEYIKNGLFLESRTQNKQNNAEEYILNNGLGHEIYSLNNKNGLKIRTIKDFIDKYAQPDKRYYVGVSRHAIGIANNKVYDTWDTSNASPNIILEMKKGL